MFEFLQINLEMAYLNQYISVDFMYTIFFCVKMAEKYDYKTGNIFVTKLQLFT